MARKKTGLRAIRVRCSRMSLGRWVRRLRCLQSLLRVDVECMGVECMHGASVMMRARGNEVFERLVRSVGQGCTITLSMAMKSRAYFKASDGRP